MIVKTKIDMDLDQAGPVRSLYAVQGDTNTRLLELRLFVNKVPWQVPENTAVQVRYGTDGGAGGIYDTLPDGSPAGTVSGNTVTVALAPQVLAQAGKTHVQVELVREDRSLTAFAVPVLVEADPALGKGEPPDYFNLRQWLREQLQSMELPGGAARITLGEVTTLAPGQDAFAAITQTGEEAVLDLGIPAGYTPYKGVDYWTEAEQQAMTGELRTELAAALAEAVAELGQIGPEFAQSTGECTDTGKVYVLPDGYLYAFMTREIYSEPPELYDPSAAVLNQRHSGTPGTVIAANGYLLTEYIQVDMTSADPLLLEITGNGLNTVSTLTPKYWKIAYYDSEKNCLGSPYLFTDAGINMGAKMLADGDVTTVYVGYSNSGQKESYYDQIAYVRIDVHCGSGAITDSERGSIRSIIDPQGGGVETVTGWLNTGHAFVPADNEERILALEETALELSRRLDDHENGQPQSIPGWWRSHLEEKAADIRALQETGGADCFSFAVLADIHENSNLGGCSGTLARYLLDNCDIQYALILGDTASRASEKSEDALLDSLDRAETILQPIRHRALQTRGNHDGAWGDDGSLYYLNGLAAEKLHSRIWRRVGMIPGVTRDDTGTAFYADDAANRVRYILLNSHCLPDGKNEDGTAQYSAFRNARFGQAQIDWLIRDALDVKTGWAIILGTHVPLNDAYTSYYGGENGDSVLLRELLEAYNQRAHYTGTAPGTMGVDEIRVEADFSGARGEVIAAMAGHAHLDTHGTYGIPVITTRCDGAEDVTDEDRALRVRGTITEQSFDVFTVNRRDRTITATKIGFGEGRVIPY